MTSPLWIPTIASLFLAGFFVGRCWDVFVDWCLRMLDAPAPTPTEVRCHVRLVEGES